MADERVGKGHLNLILNLGCSDNLHPDCLNIDSWQPPKADTWDGELENWRGKFMLANLEEPLALPDSCANEIRALDILEHLWPLDSVSGLPVAAPKISVMNEMHRLLTPGGILDLFIPTTDGRGAFQDPTHKTFWTPNDMYYYCDHFAEWRRFHEAYGITARFRVEGCDSLGTAISAITRGHSQFGGMVWKLKIRLEAIKNETGNLPLGG